MKIKEINYPTAIDFVLPRHYSGRKPTISVAFGWYNDEDELRAVCTFGKPASKNLCEGIMGVEWTSQVYELNRLMALPELEAPLSQFVGGCLRLLKPRNWIVVSYADTQMSHTGSIYQATNWLYTGATKRRTDKYTPDGKHSRHYDKSQDNSLRKVRSSKHRYVYFCTGTKKIKKLWQRELRYPILPYPQGRSERYTLGEFIQPVIIRKDKDGQILG